jgi:hypothetical protein
MAQGFKIHQGSALPLDHANVDTDQIIPKQFLTYFMTGAIWICMSKSLILTLYSIKLSISLPPFYLLERTLAVVRAVNMHSGQSQTMVLRLLLHQALLIYSMEIV